MRKLMYLEQNFWNSFSLSILLALNIACVIENGKITEMEIPDFNEEAKQVSDFYIDTDSFKHDNLTNSVYETFQKY